jgi:hypothetical protein
MFIRFQNLSIRLRAWHERRESEALRREIAYHRRAEMMHRHAVWKLTRAERDAQTIHRLGCLNDLEDGDYIKDFYNPDYSSAREEMLRQIATAFQALDKPQTPAAPKDAEQLPRKIVDLERARRERRDRERGRW